jgi:hypothetical protein
MELLYTKNKMEDAQKTMQSIKMTYISYKLSHCFVIIAGLGQRWNRDSTKEKQDNCNTKDGHGEF